MARALADIITEISSTYNPLRDRANKAYTQGVEMTQPQEQADLSGLETAKNNTFEQINTGANRRGMFFSGIPLAEQAKFTGENYLPSIAALKGRYAGIRGNLYQTLASQLGQYDTEAATKGQGIYQQELDRDEQIRQFNIAQEAARAASAGAGTMTTGTNNRNSNSTGVPGANNLTRRQQWQQEANAGDNDAQVALNYLDDNGRFDGPVNSQWEYDVLKKIGAVGDFYYRRPLVKTGSGFVQQGGGSGLSSNQAIPKIAPSSGLSIRL